MLIVFSFGVIFFRRVLVLVLGRQSTLELDEFPSVCILSDVDP